MTSNLLSHFCNKSQFTKLVRISVYLVTLPLITQCQLGTNPNPNPKTNHQTFKVDELRFNQVQFLGSHNSYKKAIDPDLLEVIAQTSKELASSLDYSHLPLTDQLNQGIRKLELDIFYDPKGGRYSTPLGLNLTSSPSTFDPNSKMAIPGFKTLHVQDIDFRSHCLLFSDCLDEVRAWSTAHPGHFPIIIMINAKDGAIEQLTQPLKFDKNAWNQLDAEIQSSLADRLLTPDDVRGDHETLRDAVLAGWPKLSAVRDKTLFILDDSNEKKQSYSKDHASLRGRMMFIDADEKAPEAAFRVVNDPIENFNYIQSLVDQGFIVRTRADADTIEARNGDVRRLIQALDSGAQVISTDYYQDDPRFEPVFKVSLPNGIVARCNPRLVVESCDINR